MLKYIISALALIAFGLATVTSAAPAATTTGTVLAVEANKVQIALVGEKPTWVKKGAVVKVTDEAGETVIVAGKIVEITTDGFPFTTKEEVDLAKGVKLTFQKDRISSGC